MSTDLEVYEVAEATEPHLPVKLIDGTPAQIVRQFADTADAYAPVVRKKGLTVKISGREYVTVDGLTLLGSMMGVFPYTVWTRKLPDGTGWEARVEARTMTGAVVGAAEAQCDRSEKSWANRDEFALRSMAATRATGKALRQPLGFVVNLAGMEATPAEEMPAQGPGDDIPFG